MAICSMPKITKPLYYLDNRDFDYLNSKKSLSKKIFIMEDMLSLTTDEHCERERIVSDMYNLLRPYYPECDIIVFGSSANGFGFTDCDLDLLFLPFPSYCNMDFKDKGSGVIPTPYHVLNGMVPRHKLYEMEEEMHLKFVERIMRAEKQYFKKIFFIPAKCPILTIEFVFNDLNCDFSASNRLVIYNTQLLYVFGRLDYRVKPLVKFLRFWAKSLGFISKSMLSSYCLTLLVIFYLQNVHPGILPSVRYLNEKAGYFRIIDGWETAICVDPDYINFNQDENTKSAGQLLKQFFDFYWNFDFVQNIVSVYDGKPLPVKLLKESKDERIRTFHVTPFSVQDPFILSRNVSRNTTMKTPFKLSLMIAKNLLLEESNFKKLFDPTYYQNAINDICASVKRSLPPSSMFLTLQLNYEMCCKLAITSQLKPWFDNIGQGILDILQYGLLIDCEVVDKADLTVEITEPPRKKRKSNFKIGDLKLIISIQCIVNFPTLWKKNRTEVLEHLKKTGSDLKVEEDSEIKIPACLKTEYVISKELSKDEIKDVTKLPEVGSERPYFSFTCNCYQYPESQLSDIVIGFSPLTNHKTFNVTKDFLKNFVKKHVMSALEA